MLRNRKKRIKEKLLSEFGNLKTDSFDFENIESYFRKKDNSTAFQILSDKTCNDLDFHVLRYFYVKDTKGREPIFSYMKYYDFSQGGYPRKVTRADRIFSLLLYSFNVLEILGIYFLIDTIKN